MYSVRFGLGVVVFCFLLPLFGPAVAEPTIPNNNVVQEVLPTLVNLAVVSKDFQGGREIRLKSWGSGVVVSPEGHVVTNYHVAHNAVKVKAKDNQGREFEAKLLAEDAMTDLAILKLESDSNFQAMTFADSDQVKQGDTVLALGNPLTLSSSVTKGVISNSKRVFLESDGIELTELNIGTIGPTGLLSQWIQHDALICPGNSGGPLVDQEGRLVGINQLGGSGLGFAIPSNLVRSFFERVLAGESTQRGWLGLTIQPRKESETKGALVANVYPTSTADQAGLKSGDILLAVDGQPTDISKPEQLTALYNKITNLTVGKVIPVLIQRDGVNIESKLKVEDLESWSDDEQAIETLGCTAQTLSIRAASRQSIENRRGVLVTGVRAGYPLDLAEPRIKSNDIILSVNGQEIPTLKDLLELGLSKRVAVDISRGGKRMVCYVDPNKRRDLKVRVELPRPHLGMKTQSLSEQLASDLNSPVKSGIRVTQIDQDSPASKAGLKVGDVITEVDGTSLLRPPSVSGSIFRETLAMKLPGEKLELEVVKSDGSEQRSSVVLETHPGTGKDSALWLDTLDACVATYRPPGEFQKETNRGVLIVELTAGGLGEVSGLVQRDFIQSVNDQDISNPSDLRTQLAALPPGAKAELKVKREQRFLNLTLEGY